MQTTPLRAFHGNPSIKGQYLARVTAHRLADQLVQGHYWEEGKGCAVGCTVHSAEHNAFETQLGIPAGLALIEDALFEGMANDEAVYFPERFLRAIPVGADLEPVFYWFLLWLLRDIDAGVWARATDERWRSALRAVGTVLAQRATGQPEHVLDRLAAYGAVRAARANSNWFADSERRSVDMYFDLLTIHALGAVATEAQEEAARDQEEPGRLARARQVVDTAAFVAVCPSFLALDAQYARLAEQLLVLLAAAPVPGVAPAWGGVLVPTGAGVPVPVLVGVGEG